MSIFEAGAAAMGGGHLGAVTRLQTSPAKGLVCKSLRLRTMRSFSRGVRKTGFDEKLTKLVIYKNCQRFNPVFFVCTPPQKKRKISSILYRRCTFNTQGARPCVGRNRDA